MNVRQAQARVSGLTLLLAGGLLRVRADGDGRLLGIGGCSARGGRPRSRLPLSALWGPEVQRGEHDGHEAKLSLSLSC